MAEVKKDNLFKKIARYFRELRSELKKVVWSTPKQVAKNTLIVIACVIVVGLFIWVFDFVAQALITAIINLAH